MKSATLTFLLLTVGARAAADPCGDDVGGRRVACRCGDTVVSDTRLDASDPVVASRCPLDGLTIAAPQTAESIRLELAGLGLRGSGVGVGIRAAHGGSEGAQIVGSAPGGYGVIAGFGTGLVSTNSSALAHAVRLELHGNRDAGARVTIAGAVFEDILVHGNMRDGVFLRGTGGRLADVRSYENGQNGMRLFTSNAVVKGQADRNGRSGIIVDGLGNDLDDASAAGNARDGIVVRGTGGSWEVSHAQGNARDDIRVNGRPPLSAEGKR